MNIRVEQEKCVSCGRCTEIASATFKMNEQGEIEILSQEVNTTVTKASDECPTEAIFVEE